MRRQDIFDRIVDYLSFKKETPKPGVGATLYHINNRYPMTIVEVSKTGKTIFAKHDQFWILKDTEGNTYEAFLPLNSEVHAFRLRKNGKYVEIGSKHYPYLSVGKRRYYIAPET